MAKFYAIDDEYCTLGVISETTNRDRKIPTSKLIPILAKYYGVNVKDVRIISEEESRFLGGFTGNWEDCDILTDYCKGFTDERVCLEESGMNYPEDNNPFDRWSSGRQFPYINGHVKAAGCIMSK